MPSDTLRQITGTFADPSGTVYANQTLTFFKENRSVHGQGTTTVLDQPFYEQTDASGAVDFEVMTGQYLVLVQLQDADRYFRVSVPDEAGPFDISTLIDGPAPVEPDDLTDFQALVNKAKAWASAAPNVEVESGQYSARHWAGVANGYLEPALAEAEGYAAQAAVDRAAAETSKNEAGTSADVAMTAGWVYATSAAGNAARVSGDYFWVLSSDDEEVLELWLRGTSASTDTGKRTISTVAVAELFKATGGYRTSTKNLFNPYAVTNGKHYKVDGTDRINANFRVSEGHAVAEGQTVSISGLNATMRGTFDPYMHFWDGAGDFISSVRFPVTNAPSPYMRVVAPAGAATFSVNLVNGSTELPPLQFEIADFPTDYEPYDGYVNIYAKGEADAARYVLNENNIFDGLIAPFSKLSGIGYSLSGSEDDVTTGFIPVEFGETYVISGLSDQLIASATNRRVVGFSGNYGQPSDYVKVFPVYGAADYVVTIDDASVKYLMIALTIDNDIGVRAHAEALDIQVEVGTEATPYMPRKVLDGSQWIARMAESGSAPSVARPMEVSAFVELDRVLEYHPIDLVPFTKNVGPNGSYFAVQGEAGVDAKGNNLFAKIENIPAGDVTLVADLSCRAEGVSNTPKVSMTMIETASGMLDNPNPLASYVGRYPLDNYAHPSIAYTDTPIGGFKYWCVASILPGADADAIWEDEDILVSNDGVTWERVRSLYETDKAYTTDTLRLPPHDFASGARVHGFLPVPDLGDTIEISMPADNGAAAVDNLTITVGPTLPWKHDPCILIDGGYVYIYHSFHVPYVDRQGGTNRFVVCTRTNDGVNWECVRSDGSTYALDSPTAARQMFTKDGSGRYNYLHYAYATGNSNPEVIKYGAGDYEFIYGANFSRRHAGTTPWDFDFSTSLPFQDVGSGNHPGLLYTGSELLLVNSDTLYRSTDRGVSFTAKPFYPLWVGSVDNLPYRKSMCMGPSGEVLVVDTKRLTNAASAARGVGEAYAQTHRYHKIFLARFDSVADFIAAADDGLDDAYIDVQVDIINEPNLTRKCLFRNYIGNVSTTGGVNNPYQLVPLLDLDIEDNDVVYVYLTLTARGDSKVGVNGLSIS